MPSGQSAWTLSSARAIAINSASDLTGLLMTTFPPGFPWFDAFSSREPESTSLENAIVALGCRFGGRLSRGQSQRHLAAPCGLLRLFADMFGEYPNGISPNARRFVEYIGREALDGVPQGQKLRLPGDALRALDAGQFVHRGVADLALDRLAVVLVQHRKFERQPLVIVAHDSVPDQPHPEGSSAAAGSPSRVGSNILQRRQQSANPPSPARRPT